MERLCGSGKSIAQLASKYNVYTEMCGGLILPLGYRATSKADLSALLHALSLLNSAQVGTGLLESSLLCYRG